MLLNARVPHAWDSARTLPFEVQFPHHQRVTRPLGSSWSRHFSLIRYIHVQIVAEGNRIMQILNSCGCSQPCSFSSAKEFRQCFEYFKFSEGLIVTNVLYTQLTPRCYDVGDHHDLGNSSNCGSLTSYSGIILPAPLASRLKLSRGTYGDWLKGAGNSNVSHRSTGMMYNDIFYHAFVCISHNFFQSNTKVQYFVTYALYETNLHSSVTFVALVLLQHLKGCFLTTRGSSGHHFFIPAQISLALDHTHASTPLDSPLPKPHISPPLTPDTPLLADWI